jgi:hypothetical protein
VSASLSVFCKSAIAAIAATKPEQRLDVFFILRYRVLAHEFPHASFSVEQAESDFFSTTLSYLSGERDIDKEIKKSDYNLNYIRWVKEHQHLASITK